jgi:hypothetical protein
MPVVSTGKKKGARLDLHSGKQAEIEEAARYCASQP